MIVWPFAFAFVCLIGFYFWSEVERYRALTKIAELAADAERGARSTEKEER